MSYLLMIVEQRGGRVTKTPEEAQQRYDDMMAFGQSLADQGLLRASEALRTDDHAVRISARADTAPLRDGPFTEAREMIGGFFLVDVASRDEALAIARRCPATAWATVEVRECAPCNAN